MLESRPFNVERFQRWMLGVITHPEGLEAGLRAGHQAGGPAPEHVGDVVLPGPVLGSADRLRIYADMYFWRLIDIVRTDFPACTHALGERANDVFRDFIAAWPSSNQRLTPLGRNLSRYFAGRTDLGHHEFLADLARLEYAKEVVFEAPRSPTLSGSGLSDLDPEKWAKARLPTIEALDLIDSRYPINRYFQAVMDEQEPEIPTAEPTWTLVWRLNLDVWRATISREQFTILSQLRSGATIGDALNACAELPGFDPEALIGTVGTWFEEWSADQVFAGLEV